MYLPIDVKIDAYGLQVFNDCLIHFTAQPVGRWAVDLERVIVMIVRG